MGGEAPDRMTMTENFAERVGTAVRYPRGGRPPQAGVAALVPAPDAPAPPGTVTASSASEAERRWAANDKIFWGVSATFDEIPAGVYCCEQSERLGPILIRQRIETDNLLELPDDEAGKIIEEFQAFWQLEPEFRQRGFLHKRGFLLWGPPGSGKTSCVQILIKRLADQLNGVTLFLGHPGIAAQGLQMLRHIESRRPLIAVLEDMDALVEEFGENEYLALLDGEAQVDNIVFLATTNYPERLDRRFVDRPSRFDTIRYIGMPSAAARQRYLEVKEPGLSPAEVAEWVRLSSGFSIAHMKELIIAVRCFKQPLREVVDRLESMHARRPSSGEMPDKLQFGFGRHRGNGSAETASAGYSA